MFQSADLEVSIVTKEVSGTIMLNLEDGSKKFLVHESGTLMEFARTDAQAENTVLASFLNFLKNKVQIDVKNINLVELTNTQINGSSLPLYVFEMKGDESISLPADFSWASPNSLRTILETIQIEGVPLF